MGAIVHVALSLLTLFPGRVGGSETNVRGLLFREQEAGYLVGYLSGLMEKARPGH